MAIYLTECDGMAGPRIDASSEDEAKIKLLWLIVRLQVPPTTQIIGVLVSELTIEKEDCSERSL